MSKNWFTSDTHFGSERTMTLSKRPFDGVSEMDNTIIENWNKVVGKNDTVYHLGDFGDYEKVKELNGRIILILGNYEIADVEADLDDFEDTYEAECKFEEHLLSLGFGEVWINDGYFNNGTTLRGIRLTHKPTDCEKTRFNLFGHVHKLSMVKNFGLNVGTDCHNFYPIDEDVVLFYKKAIENFYDEDVFIKNL